MSQIPSTPQSPTVPVAPPAIPVATPVLPNSSPVATAQTIEPGVKELTEFFGVEAKDNATAQAALRPVIDMLAKSGMQQQQQPAQPQPPQQTPATPQPTETFKYDDLDLGDDASPEVTKAFKALGERSQKAIQALQSDAAAAKTAADEARKESENFIGQQEQQNQYQVEQRAVTYLDGLASPKYGVGQSRTMVQTMAAEQVMRTAGNLIRGMQQYGQTMPIEQLMNAAILTVDGELPKAAPTPVSPAQALAPTPPRGVAPAPVRGVGSAGNGSGSLMNDAAYLDGARAILAR